MENETLPNKTLRVCLDVCGPFSVRGGSVATETAGLSCSPLPPLAPRHCLLWNPQCYTRNRVSSCSCTQLTSKTVLNQPSSTQHHISKRWHQIHVLMFISEPAHNFTNIVVHCYIFASVSTSLSVKMCVFVLKSASNQSTKQISRFILLLRGVLIQKACSEKEETHTVSEKKLNFTKRMSI